MTKKKTQETPKNTSMLSVILKNLFLGNECSQVILASLTQNHI